MDERDILLTGLEPAASWLKATHSTKLSYRSKKYKLNGVRGGGEGLGGFYPT